MEFAFGGRSCDGQTGDAGRERCETLRAAGGWGNSVVADGANYVRIPNRNVYVYNNIIYNPAGYQSEWQQFFVPAPFDDAATQADSNVPLPALADDNLQIRGNVIWNGTPEHPLGIESDAGCGASNPTCNATQLRTENAINMVEPQFIAPVTGDYRLGAMLEIPLFPIPEFPEAERPAGIPPSEMTNAVEIDYAGNQRTEATSAGAIVN
jgi:hypothetical protein